MSNLDLSRPQRQSVYGIAVIFFQKLRKAVNIIISIVIVQFGVKANASLLFTGSISLVCIGILVISILSYRKFVFYISGDEFIIEKGIFSRKKISVPFDRIQTVNINQNLIQRILNVVGLKIDTAGSAAKELEIAALPKSYANSIQDYLIEKKGEEKGVELNTGEKDIKEITQAHKPLVSLTLLDLIKVGLTENHLRTALLLFAIVNGYVWQFEDALSDYFFLLEEQQEQWLTYWTILLPIAIIVSIIGIALLSIIQSILRFYDLKFFSSEKGVQLVSGLLKRVEYQIPVHKIQWIEWSTNPLRKWVGFKTIEVNQASSNEVKKKDSITVPACKEEHLDRLLADFYPELNKSEYRKIPAAPFYKVQLIALFSLIPALQICILSYFEPLLLIAAFIWLAASLPFVWNYANKMQLEINADLIKLSKGWVFPKAAYLKHYKIQSVKLQQNIFQKRRKLVHMVFYTASGRLKMWQLNEDIAKRIYNYLLYQIEISKKNWM